MSQTNAELVPLSQATLWREMNQAYEAEGPDIWRQVPFLATNNPCLADATADLILRYICELLDQGRASREQPFQILELGSGLGKFACHVLQRLEEAAPEHLPAGASWCYILSDRIEANITFWQEHPSFARFRQRGQVAFARFDLLADDGVWLVEPGHPLIRNANPLILIANYVFDSTPQDCFQVQDGALRIGLVPRDLALPKGRPTNTHLRFADLGVTTQYVPWHPGTPANLIDNLLERWPKSIQSGFVAFPTAALTGLHHHLEHWGDALLLIHDKGYARYGDLYALEELSLTTHGDVFSAPLDLRNFAMLFEELGGDAWHPESESTLTQAVFALGPRLSDLPRTRAWLREQERNATPFDLVNLLPDTATFELLSLEHITTLFKLSHGEVELLGLLMGRIQTLLNQVPLARINGLLSCLPMIERRYFPLPMGADFHFLAGLLYQTAGKNAEAIGYYLESLRLRGEREPLMYQLGTAHWMTGDLKRAEIYLKRTIVLNPDNIVARGMLQRVQEQLPRGSRGAVETG